MKHTVAQVYKDSTEASGAVDHLHLAGVPDEDISIIMSEHAKERYIEIRENSKLPTNVTVGAMAGGAIGAVASGLVAVGSVVLSGGATLVATGPILTTLASMYVGAGIGSVAGGFAGLGYSDIEVEKLEENIKNGGVLLAVEVKKADKEKVENILKHKYKDDLSAA